MDTENTDAEVERVIGLLLTEAGKPAGAIDDSANEFWRTHYRPKFKKAIDERRREYEKDKVMLKKKARELGAEARRCAGAGPIREEHARKASEKVDCPTPTATEPIGTFEFWCN